MSDFRLGRIARALRHRLDRRQADIAGRAGVSQDSVSRVERGDVDRVTVGKLRRILAAVDAELVSYSVYAERGSIDVLGWRLGSRHLIVVEVKTEIVSVEETLRRHDSKVRLGARIAGERFGWTPRVVARLLVVPSGSTVRRRIARHDGIFSRAYPLRGRELRAWLREPAASAGGLMFLSLTHRVRGRRRPIARRRVRRSSSNSQVSHARGPDGPNGS